MQNKHLENILCYLCGSNSYQELLIKNNYHIVKCNRCGLVFVNPQPTSELTDKIYNENYFAGGNQFGYQGINYLSKENEKWFKFVPTKALNKIEKIVSQKGRLLDIGCAVGYALEVARDKGWEIYGVEISRYASKIAEKKLGITIVPKLEETIFPSRYFDVITTFEILEHIHNPDQFIATISKLLNKDGILCISTPNLDHANTLKNFKDWPYLTPPEHLFYFNKETISKLLNKYGFTVEMIFFGPINPLARGGKNIKRIQK